MWQCNVANNVSIIQFNKMRVFVLCSGRTGSVSLVKACGFIKNYSSSHESRARNLGKDRLNFPDSHIEADNRLIWFFGDLEELYGKDAYYVHLIRDEEKTAESYLKRIDVRGSVVRAFAEGIYLTPLEKFTKEQKLQVCRDYVRSVNNNIRTFLKDKPKNMTIRLEHIQDDFKIFWEQIGAEGNLDHALSSFEVRHNVSKKGKPRGTLSYRLKLFYLRVLNRLNLRQ